MNLANNLKKIRKEHNLSQEQLAEKLGVSRQSVSKWESNQAYPEMDKVTKLCQMFNLNIDDLFNQDIKEVSNNKQSKNNINKYIDDFLDYITKTIDMFSIMKFKEKIKCLFEQLVIIGILFIVFGIIGTICGNILRNIITIFPDKIYYTIYSLFESIYIIIALILGIVLLLHIFKVRYLDYYDIVKSQEEIPEKENKDSSEETSKETPKDNKLKESPKEEKVKILLEKKKEKVIIRDPKHSGYKFISGLLQCFLFLIKIFVFLIAITFCLSLITLAISLIIPFLFIKTGLLFIGTIITITSLIIINIIILIILYHFLISKKNKKNKLAMFFIISLITMGFGIGIISISIPEFSYISNISETDYLKDEITISMEDNLFFKDYYGTIKYQETDIDNIKITYYHSKYYDVIMNTEGDIKYFYSEPISNRMDLTKAYIKDINNKKIIDYSDYQIIIYASKENIKKMNDNSKTFFEKQYELVEERNNLEKRIYDLEEKLYNTSEKLENKDILIDDLKEQLQEKDREISDLQNQLEYYNE